MPWRRLAVRAGAVGPAAFIVTTTVDGLTRAGYDVVRDLISYLSLGDRGWLNVAGLLVCGLSIAALGLASGAPSPATRGARRLVAAAGASLIVVALFPIDPGLHYPPGAEADFTPIGGIHQLAALGFWAAMVGAAVLTARSGAAGDPGFARLSAVVAPVIVALWIASGITVGLDFSGAWPGAPSGLVERIAMLVALAWVVALALRTKPDADIA